MSRYADMWSEFFEIQNSPWPQPSSNQPGPGQQLSDETVIASEREETKMDIDAALARLRELLDSFTVDRMGDDHEELFDTLSEACDVFDGLDSWMTRGGNLPKAWNNGR